MKPDDRVRLRHIADALGHAVRFAEGRRRDDLESDVMLGFAIMYGLSFLANRLLDECILPGVKAYICRQSR